MGLDKKFYGYLGLLWLIGFSSYAQNGSVGIGTNTPNQSAVLDISSGSKGLLIPRLTVQERNILQMPGVNNPSVAGLLIYNSTANKFNFWTGNDWQELGLGAALKGIGTNWYQQSTPPQSATNLQQAKEGDYYLDNVSGKVYTKELNAWVEKGNLSGPQGSQGVQGSQGIKGNRASKWFSGGGIPVTANYPGSLTNDYYLDTNTGDVYLNKNTGWTNVGNIRGLQGATGASGTTGLKGPKGNKGPNWFRGAGRPVGAHPANSLAGDYYLDTNTGDVYIKHPQQGWFTSNTNLNNQAGAAGAAGSPGLRASKWFSGTTPPGNNIAGALNNDYYLDKNTGMVYMKNGNNWLLIMDLKGQNGGIPATTWYNGADPPAPALGVDGDYSLNKTTGNVYQKTNGAWNNPITNTAGASGSSGTTGASGTVWLVRVSNLNDFDLYTRGQGASTTIYHENKEFDVPGAQYGDAVSVSVKLPDRDETIISTCWVSNPNKVTVKFMSYSQRTTTIRAGTLLIFGLIR